MSHDASLAPRFDRDNPARRYQSRSRQWWRPMIPSLAIKSLRNRRFTASLTVLSIALAVALLLGVERIRQESREGFAATISGTDLVVGAREQPVHLLLYSVFHIGNATNNVRWESYRAAGAAPRGGVDHSSITGRFPPGLPGARHKPGLFRTLSFCARPAARNCRGRRVQRRQ